MSYPKDELPAPAAALDDERSFELARLWFAGGRPRLLARAGVWPDPAAWGFVLGEMARDIASLHVEGGDAMQAAALERIRAAFDAELDGHAADGDAADGDAADGDAAGGDAGIHAG